MAYSNVRYSDYYMFSVITGISKAFDEGVAPAFKAYLPKWSHPLGTLAAKHRGYFAPQSIASAKVIRIGLS